MGLNNNLPCTKSIPLSLNSCFGLIILNSIATHCISVLLYCVNAVAVRFLFVVVRLILTIPSCMKPLFITLCVSASVPFAINDTKKESTATQLNSTSVP